MPKTIDGETVICPNCGSPVPHVMTVAEAGRKGGIAVLESLGREQFVRMGRLGGVATVAKYGSEHFSAMGKKGGRTRLGVVVSEEAKKKMSERRRQWWAEKRE